MKLQRGMIPIRTRRLSVLITAIVLLFAGVAFAYVERSWAELRTTGTLNGCINRFQAVTHGGSHDPVNIGLELHAMQADCRTPLERADMSGTAYIGLAKVDPTTHQVSGICTMETFSFAQKQVPSHTFTYSSPPCGPGDYYAFSCSDVLTERQVTPVGRLFMILVGQTQADCGSYLTWHWSPNGPHPMHD
jgi:hypothetical protein